MYDVSVIVYVKDSEKYLTESLNSILHQPLENMQIVCVYENSEDDSLNILKNFSKKHSNITVQRIDDVSTNGIIETIKNVESSYVLFADSFNVMKDKSLKNLHDRISEDQLDVLLFKLNDSLNERAFTRVSQLVGSNVFGPEKVGEYLWDLNQSLYNKMFSRTFLVKQLDLYDMFVQTIDNISTLSLINSEKLALTDESLYKTNNPIGHVIDDKYFKKYVDSQNIFLNLLNKKEYVDYRTRGINKKFSDIINLYEDVPIRFKKESFETLRNYCLDYLDHKESNIHLFTDENRKHIEQIIISESVEEYELLKKVNMEKNSINFMRRYEKIISVEHKKIKNFNDNLRNSRSWKLTSIFRLRNKL